MTLFTAMAKLSTSPQARPALAQVRPAAAPHPPWRVFCPEDTVAMLVKDAPRVLATLPAGTPVAVVANRPFARAAVRRLCDRHGVRVHRELVALPSATHPLVLFDDDEPSVSRFWSSVAAIPPAPGWVTAPATIVLGAAVRAPWRWTGLVVPGRVVLGERR